MSYTVQEWAEEAPVSDTYERIILLKLARHASNDGTGTYPAIATLSRAALCDTKTVKRRLRAMEQRNIIAPGDQSRNAHLRADRRPTVYDVLVPRSWYGDQWHKIAQEAREAGRPPVDPLTRPDIAPPQQRGRAQRSDRGTTRKRKSGKKGGQNPGVDGGTGSPSTGGRTGGQTPAKGPVDDPTQTPDESQETAGHRGYPQTGGLTVPPKGTGGLEANGGTNSPGTGGLTVQHGGSNRPPNQSLGNKSGGNRSVSSSSTPSPHDGYAAGTTDEDEDQPLDPSDAATTVLTAAGLSREQALTQFWQQMPDEATPNARQRRTLEDRIWELLTPPDTWGDTEDGPARLAASLERQLPRTRIASPIGWLRNRLDDAAGGPSVEDTFVHWENCPHGCAPDETGFWLYERDASGSEIPKRCPVKHVRTGAPQVDPDIQRRAQESLGAGDAYAEHAKWASAPAGSGFDDDVPF